MTYDHWLTTEPDNGYSLEKCETCDGQGFRHVVYNWHGYPQDGEADCEDCGGEGWIEVDASGLPCPVKKAQEPSLAARVVEATVRNAALSTYPWETVRVAMMRILLDLEGRFGAKDPELEPLRAFIASGDGRNE